MTNTTITRRSFTPYEKFVIAALALTQFTVVLDFMVMSPLGDMLMKTMNLTTSEFGLAVSSYAFSAGISGILTAGFADRYDRKKLLVIFYAGFIGGTLLCGITNSYPMLIAARIVTGLFGGVIGSIAMAIVADLFPMSERGRVMGFMQMGFGASMVLGIPIGLKIANTWGWQSPFLMIVGLAAMVLVAIMYKLQPVTQHLALQNDRNPLQHLWHTFLKRDYRIGFLATALLSLGGFMMMPWGSAFAINNLKVTGDQLPNMFMASGIASLVIMPIIGKLSDKFDRFTLFTIASVWMMVIVGIYTNLQPSPFWLIITLNILMMAGIMSRMVPSMALNSALPEMQDRGAFMSISASLQQIAGGVAAGIGGMIVVQKTKTSPIEHYNTLGYVIMVLTVLCIVMVYRVSKLIKARKTSPVQLKPEGNHDHSKTELKTAVIASDEVPNSTLPE